jgi:hypothetical protein
MLNKLNNLLNYNLAKGHSIKLIAKTGPQNTDKTFLKYAMAKGLTIETRGASLAKGIHLQS